MIGKPVFYPKRYQDIKATLMWYTSIVFVVSTSIICMFLFGKTFREWLMQMEGIGSVIKLAGSGVGVLSLSGFAGYVLIFLFEIHDKIYDRYIIRWRHYYDIDFILPRLTRPFAHKLAKSFSLKAEKDMKKVMKIYYIFVGDGKHEFKIRENLIVRFYETVLKYWITQINEMILLFAVASVVMLKILSDTPTDKLFVLLLAIIGLFLVNRFLIYLSRNSLRKATEEEIQDIHRSFSVQLDKELEDLHKELGLKYGDV